MTEQPHHIFIIDDDPDFAACLQLSVQKLCPAPLTKAHFSTFPDAISACAALEETLPQLILLDLLLTGPDGFTLLNELVSHPDTARIPVIIITSLALATDDLAHYGVRQVLYKDQMHPADLAVAVSRILTSKPPAAQHQTVTQHQTITRHPTPEPTHA